MQSDDPAFLVVGTEVSAKFKGAFCEAKVKRLSKSVKCKVALKEPPFGSIFLDHTQVKGPLEVNQIVEVVQGKETLRGVIQHIKDNSIYHVVFNDGDERQLRRTQVCPKGARHFDEAVNLDALPLYNPEAFSSPVISETHKIGRGRAKRQRKAAHQQRISGGGSRRYWSEEDGAKSSADENEVHDESSTVDSSHESDDDSSSALADKPSTSTTATTATAANATAATMTRRRTTAISANTVRSNRVIPKRSSAVTGVHQSPTPRSSPRLRSTPNKHAADAASSLRDESGTDEAANTSMTERNTRCMSRGRRLRSLSQTQKIGTYKALPKCLARNRKRRLAATAATVALIREAAEEARGSDTEEEDDEDAAKDVDDAADDNDNDAEEDGDGDDDDDEEYSGEERASQKGKSGSRRSAKPGLIRGNNKDKGDVVANHSSSDDDSQSIDKDSTTTKDSGATGATRKPIDRKRQRAKESATTTTTTPSEDTSPRKKPKIDEKTKKMMIWQVGQVVAAYDELGRKGKWVPAVIVSAGAFKANAKGGIPSNISRNDVALRGFKDAKYFIASQNNLMNVETASMKQMDPTARNALDRANAFASKGTLPVSWERNHIFGIEVAGLKARRGSSSSLHEIKKDSTTTMTTTEKKEPPQGVKRKPKRPVEETSSSDDSSDSEEYGEERDQFTAQLYKFHEERGTPINKAPILGGKDIDMFRLYNVVQAYGGKKRVTENGKWKNVLIKMKLEGCPGATPITVKNAYSRYLDHFSSFCRSLGFSNWPATSSSSRSVRQIRLAGRESAQSRQKRLALVAERKKEKEKASEAKEKEAKANKEKEEKAKKEKAIKEEVKEKAKEKIKKDEKEIKKERESASSQSSTTSKPTTGNEKKTSEMIKKEEKVRKDEKQKDKEGVKEKEKQKEKDNEKDLAKEKHKGKEKAKDKELVKDKEKEKQKLKEKEKSKEIDKDKEELKEREKSKEKDKPKERTKEKSKSRDSETLVQRKTTPAGKEPQTSDKGRKVSAASSSSSSAVTEVKKSASREMDEIKLVKPKEERSDESLERTSSERNKQDSPLVLLSCSSPCPSIKPDLSEMTASGSDEEGHQRASRQRERRKLSSRERSTSTTSDQVKVGEERAKEKDGNERREKERKIIPNENYQPATVFTRFYMGQKVKAHHHGQWYDARVITVRQPSVEQLIDTLSEFEKKHAEEIENGADLEVKQEGGEELKQSASSWLNDQLEAHLKEMRCFVHYLGWNARYDVWAEPAKIKALEKDQQSSEKAFLEFVPDRVGAATLDAAFAWRSSAVDSSIAADALTYGDVLGFGSFRPRRISASQLERISATSGSTSEPPTTATTCHSQSQHAITYTSVDEHSSMLSRCSFESFDSSMNSDKRTPSKQQPQRMSSPTIATTEPIISSTSLTAPPSTSGTFLSTFTAIKSDPYTFSSCPLTSSVQLSQSPLINTSKSFTTITLPATLVTASSTDTHQPTATTVQPAMPVAMLTTASSSNDESCRLNDTIESVISSQMKYEIQSNDDAALSLLSFQQFTPQPISIDTTPSMLLKSIKTDQPATTSDALSEESISIAQNQEEQQCVDESISETVQPIIISDSISELTVGRNEIVKAISKRRRTVSEGGVQSISCNYSFAKNTSSYPDIATTSFDMIQPTRPVSSPAGVIECASKLVAVPSFENATLCVTAAEQQIAQSAFKTESTFDDAMVVVLPFIQEPINRTSEIKIEEESVASTTELVETPSPIKIAIDKQEEVILAERHSHSPTKHTSHSPTSSELLKGKMTPSYAESITNESEITIGCETPAGDVDEEGSHMISLSGRSSTSSHRHPQKATSRGAKRKRHRNSSFVGAERRPGRPSRRSVEDETHDSDEETDSDIEGCPSPKDSMHVLKARIQQKMLLENMSLEDIEKEFDLTKIDESLSGEVLIAKLQDRLQELRDIYHSVRSEQAQLDRRWRKTNEKRKQREKEHKVKEEAPTQSFIAEEIVH